VVLYTGVVSIVCYLLLWYIFAFTYVAILQSSVRWKDKWIDGECSQVKASCGEYDHMSAPEKEWANNSRFSKASLYEKSKLLLQICVSFNIFVMYFYLCCLRCLKQYIRYIIRDYELSCVTLIYPTPGSPPFCGGGVDAKAFISGNLVLFEYISNCFGPYVWSLC